MSSPALPRRKALVILGLLLGKATQGFGKPVPRGVVSVDLDQWEAVLVRWKGQEYAVAAEDIWAALREE